MVTIKQPNAVYQLADDIIRVKYQFNNSGLYLEPLYLFSMLMACYLAAMVYSRLSLDLKNKD